MQEAKTAENGLRARLSELSAAQLPDSVKDKATRSLQSELQVLQQKNDSLLTASAESQSKTANLQTLLNLKN